MTQPACPEAISALIDALEYAVLAKTQGFGDPRVTRSILQDAIAALAKDAERWRLIEKHRNYQGSTNGYASFQQAVDAAIQEARK